jgi:hypothetical protein
MTRLLLTGTVLAALATAPANSAPPQVSGPAVRGQTLRTTNGSWNGTRPFSWRYRWLRCDTGGCRTISSATRPSYVLRFADIGRAVRSRVIVSNAEGSASADSNPTAVVQAASVAGPPVNTSPPTIAGTPQQGQRLSATTGTWAGGDPKTFAYRWRVCDVSGGNCFDIANATGSSYVPTADDITHTLRVRVTARNSLGARSATSAPTGIVGKAAVPSGQTISINDVSLPNRLVIDKLQFIPLFLSSRAPFTAHFHVSDSQGHPVQGALVFVVGIPFGNTTTPPEQVTGADGWVTFTIRPTFRLPLVPHGNQPFFVRARKPGERLIAGVSTRRLVNLSVRA